MKVYMLKSTFLLFVIFPIIYVAKCKALNYCNADICGGSEQHTLCKFQSHKPASHCVDFEVMIKTFEDKLALLDKINDRRNKVASGDIRSLPSAGNMLKLVWNAELEKSAQRWANQCIRHNVPDIKDTCRNLDNVYVGQNIATIHGDAPGLIPLVLVDVWYMELLQLNASVLSKFQPSSEIGPSHYDYFTQLAWAESNQVGCGAVKFKERYEDTSGPSNRTIYRLVCNFAPGGNLKNKTVYTNGVPCSRCPKDFSCDSKHTALCSSRLSDINNTNIENSLMSTTLLKPPKNEYNVKEPISITLSTTQPGNTREIAEKSNMFTLVESDTKDDEYTFFDYISNLHEFTRNAVTETTIKPHACKNVLAVEEFIELLKKKLSTDAMCKDMFTTSFRNDQSEITSDPSVAAFISRIYSKKMASTTNYKVTENNIVNSTLLVDLVEAVIFRSGGKVSEDDEIVRSTPSMVEVSPIKVRAELAETKQNQDFTGHYFFPEEDDENTSGTIESYYDTSNFAISDIVFEIEELRKRTTTSKDFLNEIMELDSVTENSMSSSSLMLSDDLTS